MEGAERPDDRRRRIGRLVIWERENRCFEKVSGFGRVYAVRRGWRWLRVGLANRRRNYFFREAIRDDASTDKHGSA